MSNLSLRLCAGAVLLLAVFVGFQGRAPVAADETAAAPPGDGEAAVVVLELFTSQGCSSCPPAEQLLGQIGHDPQVGPRVIPLAFHVDYWNHDGWSDPFSSAAWTERQDSYARRLSPDHLYTPQLVVNGAHELNGSDGASAQRIIEAALAERPPARVRVSSTPQGANALDVAVTLDTPEAVDASSLDAVVVLVESGLTTDVRKGENSGRRLAGDFVVRRLAKAFSMRPTKGATQEGHVTVKLDGKWVAANCAIVAFAQDPKTLRIYGAARP